MHVQAEINLKHAAKKDNHRSSLASLMTSNASHSTSSHASRFISSTSKPAPTVPDGFAVVTREDGCQIIVPEYLVPASNQAFDRFRKRLTEKVNEKHGGVRDRFRPWLYS